MSDASQRLVDESEIRRIRRLWAFARDQGDWDTVASLFHPNAPVWVSWYKGDAEGFVENSRRMFGQGKPETRSKHWLGNDRVSINGDRGLLETDVEVRARDAIDGLLFDFTYEFRFFDRFEKRNGTWKIAQWTCLYDSDRVAPAVPGTIPQGFFDGIEINGIESRIAYMRFRQKKLNRPGVPVIIGGTAEEAKLKEDAADWLRQGAS